MAQAAIQSDLDDLVAPPLPAAASPDGGGTATSTFASTMSDALHRVDDKERVAVDKMAAVDSGRSDDLVGAMLASQEASLSFSMLMQVRNKVVGAMDDLIKLPL